VFSTKYVTNTENMANTENVTNPENVANPECVFNPENNSVLEVGVATGSVSVPKAPEQQQDGHLNQYTVMLIQLHKAPELRRRFRC
jgi:hypothetical protein